MRQKRNEGVVVGLENEEKLVGRGVRVITFSFVLVKTRAINYFTYSRNFPHFIFHLESFGILEKLERIQG